MTKKVLFSDEKYLHIDDTFNKQNDRIFAATRDETDDEGGIYRKTQFSPWCYGLVRGVLRRSDTISDH